MGSRSNEIGCSLQRNVNGCIYGKKERERYGTTACSTLVDVRQEKWQFWVLRESKQNYDNVQRYAAGENIFVKLHLSDKETGFLDLMLQDKLTCWGINLTLRTVRKLPKTTQGHWPEENWDHNNKGYCKKTPSICEFESYRSSKVLLLELTHV